MASPAAMPVPAMRKVPRGPVSATSGPAAAPPQRVAAELARWRASNPAAAAAPRDYPEISGEPARARDLLAGMLYRAWQRLIGPPGWPAARPGQWDLCRS